MPGVYISYPFCSQKCTFCNFASGVYPQQLEREYESALLDEIAAQGWEWCPETVYLGGGTPSLMPLDFLKRLLHAVPGRPWLEATIEAAPGSLTEERVTAWAQAGITRVSLGVQSFVKAELAKTGRKHDAQTVAADVGMLRRSGIHDINIDLIAGLAGQTEASWGESLAWIERLAAPHVSVYMLEVDEDSRLGLEILHGGSRYGAAHVPAGDQTADFYETAVRRLAEMGLRRYEISNFARPGCESRHNLKYWRLEPYIGFGADAHSFDGVLRWANADNVAEYVARWRSAKPVRTETMRANLEEEKFLVGLRLDEGIEPAGEDWQRYAEPIERFVSAGLLISDGRRLRLSSEGVLLSNEVLQEFIHA